MVKIHMTVYTTVIAAAEGHEIEKGSAEEDWHLGSRVGGINVQEFFILFRRGVK